MSQDFVVRRFEVYGGSFGALHEVELAMSDAQAKLPPTEHVDVKIEAVERPPMRAVLLQGSAAAVAKVRDSVSGCQDVLVRRDWLDLLTAPPDPSQPPTTTPPEPVRPDRRALLRIDPEGRSRLETGSGFPVVVAVVDSGIMVDHPHLKDHLWTMKESGQPKTVQGKIVHGARCMGGVEDYDITDQDGHGTMLAGSILEIANFVSDVEIMAVKFFDVITQPIAANAAQAIRFAVQHGAHIINLSFDLGIGSDELQQAIQSATAAGVLVVFAAGNTGSDNDQYPLVPACYAKLCPPGNVIVVMASDEYDERPTFSNFGGVSVDLAAPGVKIETTRTFLSTLKSTLEPAQYGRYTGTSAAAAHVTGAAALLKAQKPSRTAKDLKQCLRDSVDKSPWLKCWSGGRLNLGRALSRP
jgi:subtilisin family serine protease